MDEVARQAQQTKSRIGRPCPARVTAKKRPEDLWPVYPRGSVTLTVMTPGMPVGGDLELALEKVGVPSYVCDTTGVIRWINPAAEQLLGDVRGRHYSSVVAPEERPGARKRFAQKMLGTSRASEATGHLVATGGARVPVEVSSVPLMNVDLLERRGFQVRTGVRTRRAFPACMTHLALSHLALSRIAGFAGVSLNHAATPMLADGGGRTRTCLQKWGLLRPGVAPGYARGEHERARLSRLRRLRGGAPRS